MCESKVIVRFGEEELSFDEVAQLVISDQSLTLVRIDGSSRTITGFRKVARLEANFVRHTVLVVLE
jgi:hypothetical protein